jgi:hypothetical protein
MKKVPNPKYSITDKPEIPACAVNSINYSIGRQYKRGNHGQESCFIFVEHKGIRRYITEQTLDIILKMEFEKNVKI